MPTNRVLPAAADTPTHLVVAGGRQSLVGRYLAAAEVLNLETHQWSTVSSLPRPVDFPQMTICGRHIYLNDDEGFVFSCSLEDLRPPMPTNRVLPAAADTPTHLVVAGGRQSLVGRYLAAAEVLNMETHQWSTVSSLPRPVDFPQMTICGRHIYLNDDEGFVFSCSLEDLFKSTNSKDGGSVWTRLADFQAESSLATLRGHVLAIEGKDGAGNPGDRKNMST